VVASPAGAFSQAKSSAAACSKPAPPSNRQMKPTGRRAPGNAGQGKSLRGEPGWDGLSPRLSLPLRC
jgi:hypothetical protein